MLLSARADFVLTVAVGETLQRLGNRGGSSSTRSVWSSGFFCSVYFFPLQVPYSV